MHFDLFYHSEANGKWNRKCFIDFNNIRKCCLAFLCMVIYLCFLTL